MPPETEPADPEEAEQPRTRAEQAAVALFALAVLAQSEDDQGELSPADAALAARITRETAEGIIRLTLSAITPPRGFEWNVNALTRETLEASVTPEVLNDVAEMARAIRRGLADAPPRDPGEMSLAKEGARRWSSYLYARLIEEIAKNLPHPDWLARNIVVRKTWITRGDSRVRPLHRRLHGRTRRFSQDFWRWPYSGQVLRYPGDPQAPLDATANCRCVLWLSFGTPESVPDLQE